MMILNKSSCIFYYFAIFVFLFERSCAGKIEGNEMYTREAEKFLENMDLSVDPCTHFYNFTCGGYMKKTKNLDDDVSPAYDRYMKMVYIIKDILESKRDIPGSDVSTARNIYTNCLRLVPNTTMNTLILNNVLKKIGLITDEMKKDTVVSAINDTFNWVEGVRILRDMGLNSRLFIGFYVTPRSQTDKRNILEVREPFLKSDYNVPHSFNGEQLTIVNAGEFINSLKESLPLLELIEGFLPKDTNFSLQDEIRVDERYIARVLRTIRIMSISGVKETLYSKIKSEIDEILETGRLDVCITNALYYDYNFQVAVSKMFFTDEKKQFVAQMMNNMMQTTNTLINNSASFDERSRNKSINKLSEIQVLIGYGNNTIEPAALDWNDVDYEKYVNNILTLSKYQMDSKCRQLNLVNDVREWDLRMLPSHYNAAYFPNSNSLYLPALFLTAEMHNLELPSYIHYATTGFYIGHELGHAVDESTKRIIYSVQEVMKAHNITEFVQQYFSRFGVKKNVECLRQAFYNLTEKYKKNEEEDFSDLAGYKIAYYSFLESEKHNGYDKLLPGLNYNSRQMFWIAGASIWCDKNAFRMDDDDAHGPNYARVLLPLSNLPEFSRDFNCPIGSSMNPQSKCEFL